MWHVGIDVGGTFTDLFAENSETKEKRSAKVLTTTSDRSLGVIDALNSAFIPPNEINVLVHGTTTATNALVERKYPPVAMITTEGFRDVIEIGRQRRQHLFALRQKRPEPIVPRRLRFTLNCRLSASGKDIREFDHEEARQIAQRIKDLNINSVAICLINSYVDDQHEKIMREVLLQEHPECYVALSAETVRKFREHGRFSTTVVRAALLPVMSQYFSSLSTALDESGFRGSLLALKSNGGMMGVDLAIERPEELVESGPAGGVAYARYLSQTTNFPNIIHTDMGGTTFDASIVDQGEGLITHDYELEWEVPITIPMLDIRSVGAGGGSIAWVDAGGSLRVGPQSSGSEPGPACYGRGGKEATVTDANFILGRLNPTLGDKMRLDSKEALLAIEGVAKKLDLDPLETAEAIISITCENMAQAIKLVLTDRGRDPRDFILASFGGAGPMHACQIARAMNIPRIIVPTHAGVASAFGATAMDIRHDLEGFYYSPLAETNFDHLNELFGKLEDQGRQLLTRDGVNDEDMSLQRHAQMRYIGQFWEVMTPLGGQLINKDSINDIADAFHMEHESEHGVKSPDFPVEFVSIGITAQGSFKKSRSTEFSEISSETIKVGERNAFFSGSWEDVPIFVGEKVSSGTKIEGPAILEYKHSETVLPPQTYAEVDQAGNLIITLA
ncbi:MAG: hydantoinase [Rhodospirillaceae bacterium]|nr:hydantoinase [Rhodospirillaceae bacterium]